MIAPTEIVVPSESENRLPLSMSRRRRRPLAMPTKEPLKRIALRFATVRNRSSSPRASAATTTARARNAEKGVSRGRNRTSPPHVAVGRRGDTRRSTRSRRGGRPGVRHSGEHRTRPGLARARRSRRPRPGTSSRSRPRARAARRARSRRRAPASLRPRHAATSRWMSARPPHVDAAARVVEQEDWSCPRARGSGRSAPSAGCRRRGRRRRAGTRRGSTRRSRQPPHRRGRRATAQDAEPADGAAAASRSGSARRTGPRNEALTLAVVRHVDRACRQRAHGRAEAQAAGAETHVARRVRHEAGQGAEDVVRAGARAGPQARRCALRAARGRSCGRGPGRSARGWSPVGRRRARARAPSAPSPLRRA